MSNYTVAQYKPQNAGKNDSDVKNELNQDFNNKAKNQVIVSDLTYVRVGERWNYICVLVDLYNREIVGHSVGTNKDAKLVHRAFAKSNINLSLVQYFKIINT